MKIYDISTGVFSSEVYPGDPIPEGRLLSSVDEGDDYTLRSISLSTHAATHIDAPSHAIRGGIAVDQIHLSVTSGVATVIEFSGVVNKAAVERILSGIYEKEAAERILFKGSPAFTADGALALALGGVVLVGVEGLSIGDLAVHRALLGNGVIILEGLSLCGVPSGNYILHAPPLKLEGADGAPCRAILICQ